MVVVVMVAVVVVILVKVPVWAGVVINIAVEVLVIDVRGIIVVIATLGDAEIIAAAVVIAL